MSDHDPTYSAKLTSLLRRSERSPRVFLDGGACRGDFTALLATEFPDARIHAFEPNGALCGELEQRFRDRATIQVWNIALHERCGSIELHVHADAGTSSVLPRPTRGRRYFHSSDRVVATMPVATTSLDEFLIEHAPDGIDLLKLDTQGAELPILRGATRALQNAAIDVVYTEFFVVPHYQGAALLNDLWNVFAEFGYSLFDLFKGPNAQNGQLRFGDAIFVSPSFRARYIDKFPDEA
jgi:FkbM family methyltransferase